MRAAVVSKSSHGTPRKTARHARVPWLLNGDHLSVPEFERRYEALPEDQRAELIEGIVVMSPPISSDHGQANGLIAFIFGHYASATPGVVFAVNASVRLDGRNEYQPDVMLWITSGNIGGAAVGANGLLEGRPELVVEIALSSRSYDLNEKKAVYQRNQVPEYIVWEVMDARIQWFILEKGEYVLSEERADGTHRSRVFPGLWLNLRALLSGDDKKALRVLDKGIRSVEHKTFVKHLAKS
jgi:Uma2 family endonuclease